jgi:hypothetical protein
METSHRDEILQSREGTLTIKKEKRADEELTILNIAAGSMILFCTASFDFIADMSDIARRIS